ncbi:MAG: Uncharacterised protein [Acidimicrobiaceae bacterium]|nr:MAG: Uncharacterised protein [Acidimicrobiaceae bacterium]
MVRMLGVSNFSRVSFSERFSTSGIIEVARSTFAEYPHEPHTATSSSPAGDSTMNSTESLPPIAPEDASTGIACRPKRAKIRS